LDDVERVQEFQGTGGRAHPGIGDVQIVGSGLQFCVAEQELNGAEIHARFQQVSGEGVAERLLILLMICSHEKSAIAFTLSMT
jgi:hypothetical protein